MTQIGDQLFSEFAGSLNKELAALGSRLRVAPRAPEEAGWMNLLSAAGVQLGSIPDDVSAKAIQAFEIILEHQTVTTAFELR